jgi:aminopeptidase-like protein
MMDDYLNTIANEMNALLQRLFPITRSLTGNGNRETLEILKEVIPLDIIEYPSGGKVYDWTIPDEWNIKDAWIKDSKGNKIIDFNNSNIHVVGYSEPINKKMTFDDLKSNLHYLEDLPDAIPYRTTYYNRNWGFCVNKAQYDTLKDVEGSLEVCIDSEFKSHGSLTIGELLIPGKSKEEILISTYICHPSLANDNLSGTVLTAFLAKKLLKEEKLNYSLRFIFVPETIGAISYCANNEKAMKAIKFGFVVTTVGGPGQFGYKQSYDAVHSINSAVEHVFAKSNIKYNKYPFDIHGSDERQYSSIGFRINTISITRDKYYEYPYYHTSLDNLDFVNGKQISETLGLYLKTLEYVDMDVVFTNCNPNCEVMLSKHDLYPTTGGAQIPKTNGRSELDLRLWLLWHCDGCKGLAEISKELNVNMSILYQSALVLEEKNILRRMA